MVPPTARAVNEAITPYRTEWDTHVGTYRAVLGGGWEPVPDADLSWTEVHVLRTGGYLGIALGSSTEYEHLIETQPGLFFGERSGEAMDLRSESRPSLGNVILKKQK